jgi:hypothetical protein
LKQRSCFVANSSSSSFVCEICGSEHSGWDASLENANMVECENGHIFCEDHAEDELEKYKELQIKKIMENEDCDEENAEDLLDDYEWRYSLPSEYCPCCQLREIVKNDLLAFTLYKLGMKVEECEDMFRSEFKDLETFKKR